MSEQSSEINLIEKIELEINFANGWVKMLGVDEIEAFLDEQMQYWTSLEIEKMPAYVEKNVEHWGKSIAEFQDFKTSYSASKNRTNFQKAWNPVKNKLERSKTRGNRWNLLRVPTDESRLLKEELESHNTDDYLLGLYAYCTDDISHVKGLNSRDGLNGLLQARTFLGDKIASRSEIEGNLFNALYSEIEEKKASLDSVIENGSSSLAGLETRFDEVVNIYNEKLTLEGPVQHWKQLKDRYEAFGIIWTAVLLACIFFLSAYLFDIIDQSPDSLSRSFTEKNWTDLKSFLVVAGILSFAGYFIRLISKLALSSFHLAANAREKEQMTLVYLALLRGDDGVNEATRLVMLNSLFNKADTGLIKGDSSYAPDKFPLSDFLKKS